MLCATKTSQLRRAVCNGAGTEKLAGKCRFTVQLKFHWARKCTSILEKGNAAIIW